MASTRQAGVVPDRTGLFGRTRRLFAGAMPDQRTIFAGSLLWAMAMGLMAVAKLAWMQWYEPPRIALIASFFVAGGLVAFLPGIFIGRLLSRGRRGAGFAATFLALGIGTIALTAFFIGLQYRQYYAAWHDPFLSVHWIFQFIFTVGAAVYQFLVLGTRVYFPFGILLLAAASFWNVRGMR